MNIEECNKVISKARYQLMVNQKSGIPFLATVFLSANVVFTEHVPTFATNGVDFLINPKMIEQESFECLLGSLVHELAHVVLNHCPIIKSLSTQREQKLMNYAMDYFINDTFIGSSFKLPNWVLHNPEYIGLTIQQIYEKLLVDFPKMDRPDLDDIVPDFDKLPEELKEKLTPTNEVIQKSQSLIKQAATAMKMQGMYSDLPDMFKQAVTAVMEPKIDVETLLNTMVDGYIKDDYSYAKPNMWYPFYAPSLYSEGLTTIAYAIDLSASVTEKEFNSFLSHINHVQQTFNIEEFTIIVFDDAIRSVHKITSSDDIYSLEFSGRNGTELQPVFDYTNEINPTVLVVLSDLCCDKITEPTPYPVIWACVNNKYAEVDFGTLIHFEV